MPSGSYRQIVATKGLQGFLWTQFLGAFNDNVFKIAVSILAVQMAVGAEAGRNLSLVGGVFILPFLLFSGYAGQLADVFSKRTVLVVTKSLEIVAATLGLVAFRDGPAGDYLRRAVPVRGSGHLLQPGEIRDSSRDSSRPRSVARQRPARNDARSWPSWQERRSAVISSKLGKGSYGCSASWLWASP